MKQLQTAYSFNAAARTVTLTGRDIPASQVLLIAGAGRVLYSIADGLGAAAYTQAANSVLTLQSSQGLSDATPLTIFVDDGIPAETDPATDAKLDQVLTAITALSAKVTAADTGNVSLSTADRAKLDAAATPATQAVSGAVSVSNLPADPSTAALQSAGNATLASVDGKLPALAAGRVPVDVSFPATQPVSGPLTDAQLRAASVAVSAAALPLPSGAATDANANTIAGGAGTSPPALATGASGLIGWLRKIVDTLTGTLSTARTWTLSSGTDSITTVPSGTQTVSGTVTANTGLSQPLTDSQLRASAVAVSVSGVATAANQSTGNTSLASIDAGLGTDGATPPTLPGGATGVRGWLRYIASLFPALVSGRFPVDGSGVTQPVSAASLPLPSGAATAANQSTANTSLASIDGKLTGAATETTLSAVNTAMGTRDDAAALSPSATASLISLVKLVASRLTTIRDQLPSALGPRSSSASLSITLASDQALPLPSGAATAANQTTGNTSLSNIDSDLGAPADAAASSDTGTFSLIALVKRGLQNWTTLLARIPALVSGRMPVDGSGVTQPVSLASGLPAGTNAIGSIVAQRPFEAIVTLTRPANTTAYAANQLISTATTGLTSLPALAMGVGNSARVVISNVQILSSNGPAAIRAQLALHLFSAAAPSGAGFNDGAAFAPTAAALAAAGSCQVGIVPSSLAGLGTAAYGYVSSGNTYTAVTDGSGNLYLAIVNLAAYTPASGETFTVKVSGFF